MELQRGDCECQGLGKGESCRVRHYTPVIPRQGTLWSYWCAKALRIHGDQTDLALPQGPQLGQERWACHTNR